MTHESEIKTGNRGDKGDELVSYLRTAISSGRYVPGQRLVEVDLTAELGVSRSLLRQAFHRLSAEGLVDTVPNRGAVVKRLSFVEVKELFQIRMELETLAARLAAKTMDDREVRQIFEEKIAPIWSDDTRLSTMAYLNENDIFHTAVFTASGNGQLCLLNRKLQLSLIMLQIAPSFTVDVMNKSLSEHRVIAMAILDHDAEAADAAARAHLLRARSFIDELQKNLFQKDAVSNNE